jgi:hypothetical protein
MMQQSVDYVARAKALLKKAGRSTVMVIVPLAAAVQAQANGISALTTENFTCNTSGDGAPGSCSGGAVQLPEVNGLQGVKLYTSGAVVFSGLSSGAGALQNMYTSILTLSTSGVGTGSFGSSFKMPAHYLFHLDAGGGASIMTWNVYLALRTGGAGGGPMAVGYDPGRIEGDMDISFKNGFDLTKPHEVSAEITVEWEWNPPVCKDEYCGTAGGWISIEVPDKSIDFNRVPQGVVPEPSSYALMLAGLAALGWRLKRRRE